MEQPLLPVGLLQAVVQLLEVDLRLGAEVQHLPVEVLQPHREGQRHRGVSIEMSKLSEDLCSVGYLRWAGQIQKAHCDVERVGTLPVRGRGGQDGGDLLLQLLEAGQDGRSVGPEGDEVRGLLFRGATTVLLLSLLQRC